MIVPVEQIQISPVTSGPEVGVQRAVGPKAVPVAVVVPVLLPEILPLIVAV